MMNQLTFASLQVPNLEVSIAFYTDKLGFEVAETNPQACVFKYNQGQASFAIRTPLEPLEGRELGIGVALWFAVDENVDDLRAQFIDRSIPSVGPVIATPFGRAFHLTDPDGYKLTFLETKAPSHAD
jgi:catechol 2,3-dioxygenase-like lactoylglutathione lyase family enzyme